MNQGPAHDRSPAPSVEHAPSRGKYDREASPSERIRRQRSQLLTTVRRLASHGTPPTVTQVVNAAGVGRNTFYQHFRGAEEALESAAEADGAHLSACLEQVSQDDVALTPGQHSERLAEAWVRFCKEMPEAFALLNLHAPATLETALGQAIRHTHRALVHAGYAPAEIGEASMLAVGGAFRAVGSALAPNRASQSAAEGLDAAEAVAAVQQVLLRMLR